jgi:DNA-binding transcriptional MerR regulator
MQPGELSIGELADAAGLSRRAIRYYVQQRLLPLPTGRGRGRHYDQSHLARLRRIAELQAAGHSLDAIRRILDGGTVPAPVAVEAAPTPTGRRAAFAAELWTRLRLAEGVELHFDAARHQPDVGKLSALREVIREVFRPDGREDVADSDGSNGQG